MSFAALVVGGALVAGQAAGLAEPSGCAATAMIAGARPKVPVTAETQQLRAGIDAASASALAAERASERHERRRLCVAALLAYADLAPQIHGDEVEATRARQLAVASSLGVDAYVPARARIQALTPEQRWERRRRRLVGHTTASAVFTGIGAAMLTVPWIVAATCDPYREFCESYGAIWLSGFGAPIFVAAVIPLGIWASRLNRHLRTRPPGLSFARGRARLGLSGPGLQLEF